MSWLDPIHRRFIHPRRVRVLGGHLLKAIPAGSSVLDVGTGDGWLASQLAARGEGLTVSGIDVKVRPDARIPVTAFDGRTIPYPDRSFDVVLFVDVLHHAGDALGLLREARRVARRCVVIKDHLCEGGFDRRVLEYMDRQGNAYLGVVSPGNYRSREQWEEAFRSLSLRIGMWVDRLGLYPAPLDGVFGRFLHFIARLDLP